MSRWTHGKHNNADRLIKTNRKPATVATAEAKCHSDQRLVMPFFRVILSKLIRGEKWQIISNPRWDTFTRAQSNVLLNEANDYAEYTNCGVVYRMVRVKDLDKYLDDTGIKPEWALDPRHNAESSDLRDQPKP